MDFLTRIIYVDLDSPETVNGATRWDLAEVYDFEDLTGKTTLQLDSRFIIVRNAPYASKQAAQEALRKPVLDLTEDPEQPFIKLKRCRFKLDHTQIDVTDLATVGWFEVDWSLLPLIDNALGGAATDEALSL